MSVNGYTAIEGYTVATIHKGQPGYYPDYTEVGATFYCDQYSPDSCWVCTRELHHTGPHAAHGAYFKQGATWKNTNEYVFTPKNEKELTMVQEQEQIGFIKFEPTISKGDPRFIDDYAVKNWPDKADFCNATSDGAYTWVCTRTPGHTGPHAANYSENEQICQWGTPATGQVAKLLPYKVAFYSFESDPNMQCKAEVTTVDSKDQKLTGTWSCTRTTGHDGPHAAHGSFGKAQYALWLTEADLTEDYLKEAKPKKAYYEDPSCTCPSCKPLYATSSAKSFFKTPARTQKARGIQAISKHGFNVPAFEVISLPYKEESVSKFLGQFIRPCPTVPRHGFVDSRIVTTEEEFYALQAETLAADPLAELVAMAPVKARASAVLTPYAVTIGPGTDGATQGHKSVTLPLVGLKAEAKLLESATVTDCPYFELLLDSPNYDYTKYVQLRDGVSVKASQGNWIPKDTTVTGVLLCSNDALAFETDCKNASEGTILHQPEGSLLSHYSQHAMMRQMPIIFDKEAPSVGTELKANVDAPQPMKTQDIIRGLFKGLTQAYYKGAFADDLDFEKLSHFGQVSLMAVHNASSFVEDPNGAFLLGLSAATLLRLATAAIIGEARHIKKSCNETRTQIYKKALGSGFTALQKVQRTRALAHRSFEKKSWPSGFGGKAWADCAARTVQLEKAITAFMVNPTENNVKELIATAHNVINAAHNNGPFLSKFIDNSSFDYAAHGEISWYSKVSFMAYDILQAQEESMLPKEVISWAKRRLNAGTKRNKPVNPKIQVNFRMEESAYHFQHKLPEEDYVSCDIQAITLDPDSLAWLTQSMASGETVKSMAASSKTYKLLSWSAMPESLKLRIMPALKGV